MSRLQGKKIWIRLFCRESFIRWLKNFFSFFVSESIEIGIGEKLGEKLNLVAAKPIHDEENERLAKTLELKILKKTYS